MNITHKENHSRTGVLKTDNFSIETPCLLLQSGSGAPLNLTPDLMEKFGNLTRAFHASLHDFYIGVEDIISSGKSIHEFLNVPKHALILSGRQLSPYYEEVPATFGEISLNTRGGTRKMEYAKFPPLVDKLGFDLVESPSVEVPCSVTTKRKEKCVEHSKKWLDYCLQNVKNKHKLLAVIQGCGDEKIRVRVAREVANLPVAGFVIGSFGLGETSLERTNLISKVVEQLPETKPRFVHGLQSIQDILETISLGVDVFSCSFLSHAVEQFEAFTFSMEFGQTQTQSGKDEEMNNTNMNHDVKNGQSTNRDFKIALLTKTFVNSKEPVLQGCECFCCKNHTRAYINHLIKTHEMLAPILLTIHNNWHLLRFFELIRKHIQQGTFETFKKNFISAYPTPAPQTPSKPPKVQSSSKKTHDEVD